MTIGIPVYRAEPYIRKTMESVLSQTYPSIEFLIIDDGGGDESINIIKDLISSHPRGGDIRIIYHTTNQGVSASRNHIIDEARGDYLYFLDADDLMSENAIALLMKNIYDYDAEIVFGSYERIEVDGRQTVYQYDSLHLFGQDTLANFAYRKYAGIQASVCNFLVKISLLRDNHLRFIDSDYWEDLVFTFDLVTYISRAVLLPDITYYYICRKNSLSHYQERNNIEREEILRNAHTIDHLKKTTLLLRDKYYFPKRCLNIVMTDFYIACNIIKRRKSIVPPISNSEIKCMMTHPATFRQICSFNQSRLQNLLLYLLSKLPSSLCVAAIWILGKTKKLLKYLDMSDIIAIFATIYWIYY